jgi:serine/threonine protein kinase
MDMSRVKAKTRKNKFIIPMTLCTKKGGSRNENLTTFKTVCSPKEAHAKLLGVESIKSADEADKFIHVVKSIISNKNAIVKIQEDGRMLRMELDIQKRLGNHPNIVRYICDFACKFNPIIWTKPLLKPRTFCDDKGIDLHMIIMEYINDSLDTFLESKYVTNTVFASIVKQVGFALLDIHLNYGICHNDLNRGNILLEIGEPKQIVYSFGKYKKAINTFGHLVVFIDFQRSNLVEDSEEYVYKIVQASDEISLAYELMKKWSVSPIYKSVLHSLMLDIMDSKTLDSIVERIDTFIAPL